MEFTLFYRGPVLSTGNDKDARPAKRDHKHALRKVFASQLERLRGKPDPMFGRLKLVVEGEKKITFWPMVSTENRALAEIEVILLRPESPGSIVQQGGDIDNRLKTILDALRVPTFKELPPLEVDELTQTGRIFQCVLEDDRLITGVSVRTDQLLDVDVNASPHEAVVILKVRIDYSRTPKWLKG